MKSVVETARSGSQRRVEKGKRRVNMRKTKISEGWRLSFSSTFTENSYDFPHEQTD